MKPAARKTLLALLLVACLACLGFALNAVYKGSMKYLCGEVFSYVHAEGELLAIHKFKEGDKDGALGLIAALRALPLPTMERSFCRRMQPYRFIAGGIAGAVSGHGHWEGMLDMNYEGSKRSLDILERVFKHGTPQDLELTPEKMRSIEQALERLRQEEEAGHALH